MGLRRWTSTQNEAYEASFQSAFVGGSEMNRSQGTIVTVAIHRLATGASSHHAALLSKRFPSRTCGKP